MRTPIAILGIHVGDLPDGAGKAALEADVLRVRTLVEQLVTVARLGQNHVAMNEEVDVLKLAQDVVAKRSPIVRGRYGSRDQFTAGAALTYRFAFGN